MTTKDRRAEDRQALERVLEVYGADRTRWPARERLRFASLVAEDEAARHLLAEATALDLLLDLAPKASAVREHALKERIVAAALRQTGPRFAVVARATENAGTGWKAWVRHPSLSRAPASSGWAAGGLLAASLFVGVLLGSAGTFDTAVQQMAEATGYSATASDTSHLALSDELVSTSDEEVL